MQVLPRRPQAWVRFVASTVVCALLALGLAGLSASPAAAYNGGASKTSPLALPITPPGSFTGDNTNAPNGSVDAGVTSQHTTFWSFTPAESAQISICTFAPGRDTTLELWTGVSAATRTAYNDDTSAYGQTTTTNSGFTTNVTGGQQYVLGYGGYQASQGTASIRVVPGTGTNACTATGVAAAQTNAASSVTETTATLNGRALPVGASTNVSFQYSTSPTLAGSPTTVAATPSPVTGTASVAVSAALTNLAPGTAYYARLVANDGTTNAAGSITTFTTGTFATPIATASAATSVTKTAARLNGSVNPSTSNTTVTFSYSKQSNLAGAVVVPASPGTINAGSGATLVTAQLSALESGTTYYFRVNATNSAGTENSSILSFTTTGPTAPTVNSLQVSDIAGTTATVQGEVVPNGAPTTTSFEYATVPSFAGSTIVPGTPGVVQGGASTTQVAAALVGLDPATRYYYRLRAENGVGGVITTGAGNFLTANGAPSVLTEAGTVSSGEYTIFGSANPNGLATTVKFIVSTDPNMSGATDKAATPSSISATAGSTRFSSRVTGQPNNTRFYYQAVATNALGTTYGPITRVVTPNVNTSTGSFVEAYFVADITWPVESVFTITGAQGGSVAGGVGGRGGAVSGRFITPYGGKFKFRTGTTSNTASYVPPSSTQGSYGGAGMAIGGGSTEVFASSNNELIAIAGGGGGAAAPSCVGGAGGLNATPGGVCPGGAAIAPAGPGTATAGGAGGGTGANKGAPGTGPWTQPLTSYYNGGAAWVGPNTGGGGSGFYGGGGGGGGTVPGAAGAGGGGSSRAGASVAAPSYADGSNSGPGAYYSVLFRIATQALPNATPGRTYRTALTAQNSAAGPDTWSIMSGSLPAGLTLGTDGVISGVPKAPGTSTMRVKVISSTGGTWEQPLTLTVGANPVSIATTALGGGTPGIAYNAPISAVGGTSPYGWTLTSGSLPSGLSLNPTTGVISGTPTAVETRTFTLNVRDASGQNDTQTLTIVIQTPTITTVSLPVGSKDLAYSGTVEAIGGDAPRTFSIAAGELPAGLSLNGATGEISGTPTAIGTSGFRIEARDASARVGSANLTITINNSLSVTTTSLPTATSGGPTYSATLVAAGGIAPHTWSIASGALPAGASLNSATGEIRGDITSTGTANFTVRVTDANNVTATKALSIVVSPPVNITTTALDDGTIGIAYSRSIAASGGLAPLTWQIKSGALPAGLALNAASGAITGTPTTAGSSTFTVRATDANGAQSDKTLSITIYTAATVTTTALGGGSPQISYAQTLAATGGKPGYVWAVATGSLPTGLTLNSVSGVISGTPTAVGTSTFTVRATDALGATATKALSIVIATPAIANATVDNGTVGYAYSDTFVTVGGDSPYTYAVVSGTLPTGLTLNTSTGELSGTPTAEGSYTFSITATDSNQTPRTSPATPFTVQVFAPVVITTTELPGATSGGAYTQQLTATGGAPALAWSVDSGALPAGLSLDSNTGELSGTPSESGSFTFTIEAQDANGASGTKSFTLEVAEALAFATTELPGSTVGADDYSVTVSVDGGTSPLTWAVPDAESMPPGLNLDSSTGEISGNPGAAGTFSFDIVVTDSTGASITQTFTIVIAPAPVITTESAPGTTVGTDYDLTFTAEGGVPELTWSIASGDVPDGLVFDAESATLSGTPAAGGSWTFTLAVTDDNGSVATKTFTIVVADELVVESDRLGGGTPGTPYSQTLTATGGTAPLAWSIEASDLPPGLSLDPATGVISGTPTQTGTYEFEVTVTDDVGVSSTRTLSIIIATPAITNGPLPGGTVGRSYAQTLVAAGGVTPYSWLLTSGTLPPGLTLNPNTGEITGTPTTAGSSIFTVQVTDAQSRTSTAQFTVAIAAAVAITTPTLPASTVGAAYSQMVTATGGTSPRVWSIASGALPAGLSLNTATGAITGSATTAGSFGFTVMVADANGSAATQAYSVAVAASVAISTSWVPQTTQGSAYSTPIVVTGGSTPLTWSISNGSLPAGLSINGATGVIAGTPSQSGNFTFTVRVVDSLGIASSRQYTLLVNAPLTIVTASLPEATEGWTYVRRLEASGGTAPVTWTVTAGALPQGITLTSSGELRGIASAAGTSTFTAAATDAIGQTVTRQFNLVVNPRTTLSPPSLPSTTVSAPYNQTLTASGGTAPLTWSLAAGALPAGLTFDPSTHVISGVTTAAGTSYFSIRIVDANGLGMTRGYTIGVSPAPVITTTTLPSTTVSAYYNQPIIATGGQGPRVWAITMGTLPPGLTLNSSSGVISGVPQADGAYTFSVRVTDREGVSDTQDLTITVSAAPQITTTSLPGTTVGIAYSQTLVGTGGQSPVSWLVNSGTIPPGLALSSTTGELSGTTSAPGAYNFSIRLRDANNVSTFRSYVVVVAAAPVISTTQLGGGTPGIAYSQTLSATGGTAPLTWSTSGTLPDGISLDSSTGVLSGTPTTLGTSTFTAILTDAMGVQTTKSLSIIIATPTFATGALPGGTVGRPYSQNVEVEGGDEPYTWSLVDGTLPDGLTLNTATGEISGTPEVADDFTFTLGVVDSGARTATNEYTVTIAEPVEITTMDLPDSTVGASYGQTVATAHGTAPLTWSVSSGALPAGITLDPATGELSGVAATAGLATFVIEVTDANGSTKEQPFTVVVAAAPEITTDSLPDVTESALYSQQLTATGGQAPLVWAIDDGELPSGLMLDAGTGIISGTPTVSGTFSVAVSVTDANGISATVTLTLTVVAAPVIDQAELPDTTVGAGYSEQLTVTGGQEPITWAIATGALPDGVTLDTATGEISGTPTASGTFAFTVTATDGDGVEATKEFTITVSAAPEITTATLASSTVSADYNQTLAVTGGQAPLTWSIESGGLPDGLSLDASTGAITGSATESGDFTIRVVVSDANGINSTHEYTITIYPAPVITTGALPSTTVGAPYAASVDATGGQSPLAWAVDGDLPPGLALNPATGEITGTPTTAASYTFAVIVTDANSVTTRTEYTVVIVAAPVISTDSLPAGTQTGSYDQTISVTGGKSPLVWEITGGELPDGLVLDDETGTISGVANESGTFAFTVKVTDENGIEGTKEFVLVIGSAPQITTTEVAPATAGTPFSQTLVAEGGTAPLTWVISSGALPAGLTFNSSSGQIEGTATEAGSVDLTFEVTDVNGVTTSRQLSFTVYAAPAITTTELPATTEGETYSQTVSVTGGTPPLVWDVADGSLPAGISLDPATGTLSGEPTTAGDYTFTLRVTDANGATAEQELTVVVSDEPVIDTTSLPQATVSGTYSATLTATGGALPLSWSITDGELPDGIGFDEETGQIAGKPTEAGSFTLTFQVTDNNGASDSVQITFVVADPPAITTSTLADLTVGTSTPRTLQAQGGTAPLTWSLTSGTLPAGLTLDPGTGTISGAATASGRVDLTFTVTDANQVSATRALTLAVNAAPTIGTTSLPNTTVGLDYSQTVTSAGGSAPLAWSVGTGSLPPGITLNPATGQLSGEATGDGVYSFTIVVTDANGSTVSQALTITVSAAPTITTSSLAAATVTAAYSQTVVAAGGETPLTWSITDGALPDGLSLSTTTGAITGTPTASGSFAFTVRVADNNGARDDAELQIVVAAVPDITTGSLPGATLTAPYAKTLAVSGGTAPLTWSIANGSLPAGLAIDPDTGEISGTPTVSGSETFDVVVTDANGVVVTREFTLVVANDLTITTTELPDGTVGANYSQLVETAGGTSPLEWTVDAGSLPGGLNLNSSTGRISGSPTTEGSFTFTIEVAEANGLTAQQEYTVVVIPPTAPAVAIDFRDLPDQFVLGQKFKVKLEVSASATGRSSRAESADVTTRAGGVGIDGTAKVYLNDKFQCTATIKNGVGTCTVTITKSGAQRFRATFSGTVSGYSGEANATATSVARASKVSITQAVLTGRGCRINLRASGMTAAKSKAVTLQRKVGGRWVTFATTKSGKTKKWSASTVINQTRVVIRAKAQGSTSGSVVVKLTYGSKPRAC